jgi:hypothetical protein
MIPQNGLSEKAHAPAAMLSNLEVALLLLSHNGLPVAVANMSCAT